ncbi:hypothetical protein F4802DRAFT_342469 [Xylaria palmicola]|nr:hypothetical protein F4802DRAFT_342469 [Xylaria palmicola]
MQFPISLVAVLAATCVALPAWMTPRQLGGLGSSATAPITGALGQVGKQVPPALTRVEGSLDHSQKNKNATKPATAAKPASDPLGGLGSLGPLGSVLGLLGGI